MTDELISGNGRGQAGDVVCSMVACYCGNSLVQVLASGSVTWGSNIGRSIVFAIVLQTVRMLWIAGVDRRSLSAPVRRDRYRWENGVILVGCYLGTCLLELIHHSPVTWKLNVAATVLIMVLYLNARTVWVRTSAIMQKPVGPG
jgi:hypothetical protein